MQMCELPLRPLSQNISGMGSGHPPLFFKVNCCLGWYPALSFHVTSSFVVQLASKRLHFEEFNNIGLKFTKYYLYYITNAFGGKHLEVLKAFF